MLGQRIALRYWIGFPLLGGVLVLGGCSTARAPVAEMAQAETAVQQASDSKAPQYAPTELQGARGKLLSAQQAASHDEYNQARRLAEQATVDAQFAQTKGAARDAQQDEAELRSTVDALRSETLRTVTP